MMDETDAKLVKGTAFLSPIEKIALLRHAQIPNGELEAPVSTNWPFVCAARALPCQRCLPG